MKHIIGFLLKFVICVFVIYGGFCGVAVACENNEIDVLGDGTQCELAKFSLTTTSLTLPDESEFRWYMSAKGTFYVDWGDGTVDTITRTNTTETLYSHTFTTSGTKTIRFGGLATEYSTISSASTIRFYGNNSTHRLVAAISGSIGQIFSTLGQSNGQQPRFYNTFRSTQIESVPENLFSGINGQAASYMFKSTFESTRITNIPENIFINIHTCAPGMFSQTFASTPIQNIPENLFSYITSSPCQSMFAQTFLGCFNLRNLPENLFVNIKGVASGLFNGTFYSCINLESIPSKLFANINGVASHLFYETFRSCKSLRSIPSGLFAGVTGGAQDVFSATFLDCTSLTSLPEKLFANIKNTGPIMFHYTFSDCTSLSGYIPPSMFAGLIANNSPYAMDMMGAMFVGTALATTCPPGTVQFVTGYEEYWDGHVSCVDENLVCNSGEYFPAHWYECKTCPENNYCVGGTYPYSETVSAGATQCPHNGYSNTGASSVAQCYRILHVGNNELFLRGAKKTTPSLNIDINNDGVPDFFGNMTTADVPMNSGTARKLKVSYDGVTYSVYDDTVTVPE